MRAQRSLVVFKGRRGGDSGVCARQEIARITAGIGAARGKRIEPLLCVIPDSVPLLEGRGVRGGLTGGPTEPG